MLCLRPTPETQAAVQAALWSRKARIALLAHLGSNRSRTHLAVDCPALANALAEQILSKLLAELNVSELVESLGKKSVPDSSPVL